MGVYAIPFHRVQNDSHHWRSDLKSLLSRIRWWGHGVIPLSALCRRSIIHLRNDLPGRMTLHAWFNTSTSDSSSRREQSRLYCQETSKDFNQCNLSSGRRSWPVTVLISIPKIVRHVAGPSTLCAAMGTPSSAHVPRVVFKERPQSGESGGPQKMKSSM